jgi:hypothetical protein
LLEKLILQVAHHLRYRAVAEFFGKLTAPCELGLYCLFFPIPVHNRMTLELGKGSKQATPKFNLGHWGLNEGQYRSALPQIPYGCGNGAASNGNELLGNECDRKHDDRQTHGDREPGGRDKQPGAAFRKQLR